MKKDNLKLPVIEIDENNKQLLKPLAQLLFFWYQRMLLEETLNKPTTNSDSSTKGGERP